MRCRTHRRQAPETEQEIALIDDADAADRRSPEPVPLAPGRGRPVGGGLLLVHARHACAESDGTYSTIASQITVSGGYFAIDEFLFLLETLRRAAKVDHDGRDAVGSDRGGHDDVVHLAPAPDHGGVLHDGYQRRSGLDPGSDRNHRSVAMQLTPRDKKILQIAGVALPLC